MRIDNEEVKVRVLQIDESLALPKYETALSAGMDLRASFHSVEDGETKFVKVKRSDGSSEEVDGSYAETVILNPGDRALIPTGIILGLPEGYEAQIRPRSGLAWKYGITVLNSPGTIDADFRNCVGVLLINEGSQPFEVKHGERIAQMVIVKCEQVGLEVVSNKVELGGADRGGGWGHTGK